MIYISHRGNVNGRNEPFENMPAYIDYAISKGYDVEVDIWYKDNMLWLGHDMPNHIVDSKWLIERYDKLWIHCKNIEAMDFLKNIECTLNYFWHQEDDVTITSIGHFWTYPGKKLTKWSIAVMPEIDRFENIDMAYGICSDEIEKYNPNIIGVE